MDTPEQRLDLIMGWFVPILLEKCKDNEEARINITKLIEILSNLDTTILLDTEFYVGHVIMVWSQGNLFVSFINGKPLSNDFDYNIPSQYSFDMLVPRLGW